MSTPRELADEIQKVLEGEMIGSGMSAIGIVLNSLLVSVVEEEGPLKAEAVIKTFISILQESHTEYVQEVYKSGKNS